MKDRIDPVLILGVVENAVNALRQDRPALALALEEAHDHLVKIAENIEALSHPLTEDFIKALEREQQFQRLNWGLDHDASKSDDDWFWLIAFLTTKAKQTPAEMAEKKRHRLITAAAALMNWHAQEMRDE